MIRRRFQEFRRLRGESRLRNGGRCRGLYASNFGLRLPMHLRVLPDIETGKMESESTNGAQQRLNHQPCQLLAAIGAQALVGQQKIAFELVRACVGHSTFIQVARVAQPDDGKIQKRR